MHPYSSTDQVAASIRVARIAVTALGAAVVVIGLRASGGVDAIFGEGLTTAEVTDDLWVLTCAALVFIMQAGFLAFEVGLAREPHTPAVAMKNVIDWTAASLAFFLAGFAIMFGPGNAFVGWEMFALEGLPNVIDAPISGPTFFIFQLAFAGTAITIVSGSLVERTSFLAYSLASIGIGLVIYPLFGRWAWAGAFSADQEGWLERLGFIDFAGSTVVHSVGAWVALVGVVIVGPRIGRFDHDGKPRAFPPSNLAFTVLGVLILWFGWWGFNGGSHLQFDLNVPRIILVTNLSGVSALAAAGLHAYLFQNRENMYSKLIGGTLAGLVAITAGAAFVDPLSAIAIGVVAGVIHNVGAKFLESVRIDDALGAIPVHGFAGVWGTLAVAFFARSDVLERSRLEQLGVQAFGVAVCFVWTAGMAWIMFRLIQRFVGLRVSPAREIGGLVDWVDEPTDPFADDLIDEDELRDLLA